jgi:anti-sigma regulatory factor (Ser/Thr protein kinase)
MVDATHISFAADDRSYFSLIKKEIHQKALDFGLPISRVSEVDIIVAEMTSNLFKYGCKCEILVGSSHNFNAPYFEIISIDSGPGMANPARMVQDGISTTKTLGQGLGSIKRLSDTFEIYSQPGWGTIVLSRIYKNPADNKFKSTTMVRPLVLSKPGEITSGDGFYAKQSADYLKIMLADGLGHGPEANLAVNEAARSFKYFAGSNPVDILKHIHLAIKKTRGAVVNVIVYDIKKMEWLSAGIGNIAVKFFNHMEIKNHLSYNGIVGHNIPGTMSSHTYPAGTYSLAVLCSDGIKTRWDLTKYPLISRYDPCILNAAIYKDHARKTDDMSIVSVKIINNRNEADNNAVAGK